MEKCLPKTSNTRLQDRRFAVSTKEGTNDRGDEIWHSRPIGYEMAKMILVHHGWTGEQADADLAECPDKWIPVNGSTQIT